MYRLIGLDYLGFDDFLCSSFFKLHFRSSCDIFLGLSDFLCIVPLDVIDCCLVVGKCYDVSFDFVGRVSKLVLLEGLK